MASLNKILTPKTKDFEDDDWISISDLMAVLMIVFLFIAIVYMKEVLKEAKEFQLLEDEIYTALYEEFDEDLASWNASIDKEKLIISFSEPRVFFDSGQFELKPLFKEILDNFFPRYLGVLRSFKDNIEEIRIEGHTSTKWLKAEGEKDAYFLNMELSQARTRNVLQYCLTLDESKWGGVQRMIDELWARPKLTANGLSSSQLIYDENGKEDEERSQRVVFRVKADSGETIRKLLLMQ